MVESIVRIHPLSWGWSCILPPGTNVTISDHKAQIPQILYSLFQVTALVALTVRIHPLSCEGVVAY